MKKSKITVALLLILFWVVPSLLTTPYFKYIYPKSLPEDVNQFSRNYIEAIKKLDFDTITKMTDTKNISSSSYDSFRMMAQILANDPSVYEVARVVRLSGSDINGYEVNYQLRVQNRWLLSRILIDNSSGKYLVSGFGLFPLDRSLQETNGFNIINKSAGHYVIFILAAILSLFLIYTVFLWIDTKIKWKWIWLPVILFGLGQLKFDWTTGELRLFPIAFYFPPFSFYRMGLVNPYILVFAFPIGALVFNLLFNPSFGLRKAIKTTTQEPDERVISISKEYESNSANS